MFCFWGVSKWDFSFRFPQHEWTTECGEFVSLLLLSTFHSSACFSSFKTHLSPIWIKPAVLKGWNKSSRYVHLRLGGPEAAVPVQREPPHKHFDWFGPADVFWRGHFCAVTKNTALKLHWDLKLKSAVCLNLTGDFLRDRQQKPELREKETSNDLTSTWYSWQCHVCWDGDLWEFFHQRRGLETQHLGRKAEKNERWSGWYEKMLHFMYD